MSSLILSPQLSCNKKSRPTFPFIARMWYKCGNLHWAALVLLLAHLIDPVIYRVFFSLSFQITLFARCVLKFIWFFSPHSSTWLLYLIMGTVICHPATDIAAQCSTCLPSAFVKKRGMSWHTTMSRKNNTNGSAVKSIDEKKFFVAEKLFFSWKSSRHLINMKNFYISSSYVAFFLTSSTHGD